MTSKNPNIMNALVEASDALNDAAVTLTEAANVLREAVGAAQALSAPPEFVGRLRNHASIIQDSADEAGDALNTAREARGL